MSLVAKDSRGLTAALDSLSHYAKGHFEREEKIASAAGYVPVP
jgi:hemerythrin